MLWKADSVIYFSFIDINISIYNICCVLAFLFSLLYIFLTEVKENLFSTSILIILIAYTSIFFGRLGYFIFYNPPALINNPIEFFRFSNGGISSHGSAIGIFITIFLFTYFKKFDFWIYLDKVLILCLIAGFFIRIGNLFNSEKIGNFTNSIIGITFINNNVLSKVSRHPIQLYEAAYCLALFLVILISKNQFIFRKKLISGLVLFFLFLFRFLIGFNFNDNITIQEQSLNICFFSLGIILIVKTTSSPD